MAEVLDLRQFTPETPLEIEASDGRVSLAVADVIRWLAPQAPPVDALKFLLACRSMGLNPFIGEAYLVHTRDAWITIVAKAGYLKRAQRDPRFKGHRAGVVLAPREGGATVSLEGTVVPPGYLLVGGWAEVYKEGLEHPVRAVVSMNEYDRGAGSFAWKTMPATMIRKVALVSAIREAFAIGDSYDEVEAEPIPRMRPEPPTDVAPPQLADGTVAADEPAVVTEDHEQVARLLVALGATEGQVQAMLARRHAASVAELSSQEAASLRIALQDLLAAREGPLAVPAHPRRPARRRRGGGGHDGRRRAAPTDPQPPTLRESHRCPTTTSTGPRASTPARPRPPSPGTPTARSRPIRSSTAPATISRRTPTPASSAT
jgi:phage recombination protein Bet